MKYNLSEIMTEAHRLRIKYSLTLSEGLKMSWAGIKTGTTYQDWRTNKIDSLADFNRTHGPFKLYYDVSPAKYLKTQKAVMSQIPCDINIDTLDFTEM